MNFEHYFGQQPNQQPVYQRLNPQRNHQQLQQTTQTTKTTQTTQTSQNFVMRVRLVFQSEITDWTLVESLKIISMLKFFQTLDQSLPRNSF